MASPSKQGLAARARGRVPNSLRTGNYQGIEIEHRPCRAPEETMNKWQRERAVMDELLRMEEAGEVRQNPDTGQWETGDK